MIINDNTIHDLELEILNKLKFLRFCSKNWDEQVDISVLIQEFAAIRNIELDEYENAVQLSENNEVDWQFSDRSNCIKTNKKLYAVWLFTKLKKYAIIALENK